MVAWTTPNYDWRYLSVRLSTPKRPAALHKLSVFPFPNQPIFQDVKELCSGGRTRTGDLQVMSLASYQLLPPRNGYVFISPPRIVPNRVAFFQRCLCFPQKLHVHVVVRVVGFPKEKSFGFGESFGLDLFPDSV